MTRYGSADVAFLLVSGINCLGHTTVLNDDREANLEDTTVLGDAWESQGFVGTKKYHLTQQGFYDDAVNSVNQALVTPGASKVLSFGMEQNVVGRRFVGSPAVEVKYERQLARGVLTKANTEYVGEGAHEEGIILHTLKTEVGVSGDTQGAESQDNSVLTSNGGAAYFQTTSLTLGGYTSVTLKVRHSVDDITYADLATAAVVIAAPNGQRIAVSGTVNRHLAHSWLFNGAGGGQFITYFVGFGRN